MDTSWETMDEDVIGCMEEYCERNGMWGGKTTIHEVARKMPQNVWVSCMKHIGRRLFKGEKFFKELDENGNYKRDYKYDRELLQRGVDYYVELCQRYDKLCELSGLTAFLGVGRQFFDLNGQHSAVGDDLGLRKKIYQASEDTATGLLVGGSRTPMAVLPYLNHKHGWDKGQVVETRSQSVLTGSDLPRLGMSDAGAQ